MNGAQIHLFFNHFPIILITLAFFQMAIALIMSKEIMVRASLIIIVFAALFGIPTFLSGEEAEEIIEEQTEISHEIIHEHEEKAELAIWFLEALGALSLIALILRLIKHPAGSIVTYSSLLFSVVVLILLSGVGKSGGEIRHTEVRESVETSEEYGEYDDD